jgi:dynactin complex subunit
MNSAQRTTYCTCYFVPIRTILSVFIQNMFFSYQASTFQMGILLMFNNETSFSVKQIQEHTGLNIVSIVCDAQVAI